MKSQKYDYDFYVRRDQVTTYSAEKILNILKEYIDISSAVDTGGG